jgi:hypothetical protein
LQKKDEMKEKEDFMVNKKDERSASMKIQK